MPQMMPMNWLLLFIFFLSTSMFFLSLMFFFPNLFMKKSSSTNFLNKKINLKW